MSPQRGAQRRHLPPRHTAVRRLQGRRGPQPGQGGHGHGGRAEREAPAENGRKMAALAVFKERNESYVYLKVIIKLKTYQGTMAKTDVFYVPGLALGQMNWR